MKTLIIALNSKFIHSSLAPWYLKADCGSEFGEIKVMEFTINDNIENILAAIYLEKADVAAFSCYIWNIGQVFKLIDNLKRVSPKIKTILGGPEVSFDAQELIVLLPEIDFIISGEGESSFKQLIKNLNENISGVSNNVQGLTSRQDLVNSDKSYSIIKDLDSIPSPYTSEMLASLEQKIVYFESSRGCPFSCSYCLSSTYEGVRYFSLDRVRKDLCKLIEHGVRQVKFVDRTFNCNKARAKEIFGFLIEYFNSQHLKGKNIESIPNFHFEVAGDLFDDEILDLLSNAHKGLIQFEIGVQTTNIKTLEAINRKTNLKKVFYNIQRIKAFGNINIHLDLIAGLPFEDYESFKNSFDSVYLLRPHQLQLGFLKLLKGSTIRAEAEIHQYRFRTYPPYEILFNKYISFDEVLELKGVEELIDRYYNSLRFNNSLDFIIGTHFNSPYEFYLEFLNFNKGKGLLGQPVSSRELYNALFEFSQCCIKGINKELLNDMLKFDYLSSHNSSNLPEGLKREFEKNFKEQCFEFLKDEINVKKYIPRHINIPAKEVFKQVHFEIFNYDVAGTNLMHDFKKEKTIMIFDYSNRDKVTGLYNFQKISI